MEKSSAKVCVTGSAGYIGSALANQLLEKGSTVHATLRNLNEEFKVGLLRSFPNEDTRRQLFEADIYKPEEFEKEIDGCAFVFHLAVTWFHSEGYEDYTHGKTLAEKELLGILNDETIGLVVVTLACGLVRGNARLSYIPQTVGIFIAHITDEVIAYNLLKLLEDLNGKLLVVHLEDVCRAHIFCMETPSIKGRLLCASSYIPTADLANCYHKNYPEFSVKQEYLEGQKRDTKWGSTKLQEKGFVYRNGAKMVLDE